MNLEGTLFELFGFKEFRPGQKEIITSLLENKDTIGVLPTGTGKSLCYQFVGNILDGHVLIVSPLLSLMQDQVEQMKAKGEKSVVAINSFLNHDQKNVVIHSLASYKFIFISPEMLQVEYIFKKLQHLNISLFVIDEAHCISQWGYDFRTDYLKLGEIRKQLQSPLTLALTATATTEVTKDIILTLAIQQAAIYETTVDRPNIAIKTEFYEDMKAKQLAVISHLKNLEGPGIIYFSSKKLAEQTVELLKLHGITKVMAYHGGMTHEDRILIQQQFLYGQVDYICATSAFGMGINKEDIRFVIHFHMPLQMESYLQEIGRAGRDGKQSIAILLYANGDESLALQLAEGELPSLSQLDWLTHEIDHSVVKENVTKILTEEIRHRGGFTEIQWRVTLDYIQSHFDQHGTLNTIMNKFKNFVCTRRNLKIKKIFEMVNFIKKTDCKRNAILNHFGEPDLAHKISNCCDHCGLNLNDFHPIKSKSEEVKDEMKDWVWKLTKLLTPIDKGE
ncbi:RecQ family ATP-dependent DNA helicase [Pseudoneobacillus rhizosphaerae]|uniref:ATP-dependent DNA helicase RecQ n=1 Tax=Pseudoneobacillus rhizosphaerae TaxID=2880968 RepID=A0A9C7LAE3_9BACI|nr:RecQ family ATP-dependent DNA helicase [Pseudoneobacillus rhizosphaerae]CAG9608342.1 ATP-dependent RNA helicase DbpA [Pseudoneobacillus rhizosphaerae]